MVTKYSRLAVAVLIAMMAMTIASFAQLAAVHTVSRNNLNNHSTTAPTKTSNICRSAGAARLAIYA